MLYEVITELNILTYRYCPEPVQQALVDASKALRCRINNLLDLVNRLIQKAQREYGKTFVSRTRLRVPPTSDKMVTVLRAVLANPLTTDEILAAVLEEQTEIVKHPETMAMMAEVDRLCAAVKNKS